MRFSLILHAVLLLAALAFGQEKKPVTADDLIQMKKAGFNEQIMIKAIEANGTSIDTSTQSLLTLKSAGLSDSVIKAVLSAGSPQSAAESIPPGQAGTIPDEVGVYVKSGDQLVRLEPETATMKSSGFLKSAMTAGIARASMNGVLRNPSSQTLVSTPVEFQIKVFEGVSANEYQLLRLQVKGNKREFRTGSSGLTGMRSGADPGAYVAVEFERISSGLYRARIAELEPGEYGWFQGGIGLKVYTFRVSR